MESFGTPHDVPFDFFTQPLLYLEGTAPFFLLEAALLLALSAPAVDASDRMRIGCAVCLTSAASLAALGLAVASGLPQIPAALAALGAATVAVGARAAMGDRSLPEVVALLRSDASDLVGGVSAGAGQGWLTAFYRLSALLSLLVGASIMLSPVSPIAFFATPETPATHWMRQELGIYFSFLLCPVQAALFRAAKVGDLGAPMIRMLSIVTGVVAWLLIGVGLWEVKEGANRIEAFLPGDPQTEMFVALQDSQSYGRGVTNIQAVTIIGLIIQQSRNSDWWCGAHGLFDMAACMKK